jgi:hypothetical protein
MKQRYELNKHLQNLHVYVALFSDIHLKPHEKFFFFFFQINTFIEPTDTRAAKGGTAVAVRRGVPHNHVDLPAPASVEATGVFIPNGNGEELLSLFINLRACLE